MPKVLLYITAKAVWTFLFWGTDANENRAHIHVGKAGTKHLAKIWLEPEVTLSKKGSLTDNQINDIIKIVIENKSMLLKQWKIFKSGKNIRIIKIKR